MFGRREGHRRGADFRNDLLRRVDAETGHGREALHRILVDSEERGEFVVQLLQVRINDLQLHKRHRQQSAVQRMQVRRGSEGIPELLRHCTEPTTAESGKRRGIGPAVRDRAEHPSRTHAEQVRHPRRQLAVGFLEEGLEAIRELYAIPCQLVLPARHGAPEALRRVGDNTEREFMRHQPLDQTLGIREVPVLAVASLIGLGLREMQGASRRPRIPSYQLPRLPVAFQGVPHWTPVLRRRLHHDVLDGGLDQLRGQALQVARRRPERLALEVPHAVDFDVRDHAATIALSTSMPAIRYAICVSTGGAENVL
jgi:hypothetical protein